MSVFKCLVLFSLAVLSVHLSEAESSTGPQLRGKCHVKPYLIRVKRNPNTCPQLVKLKRVKRSTIENSENEKTKQFYVSCSPIQTPLNNGKLCFKCEFPGQTGSYVCVPMELWGDSNVKEYLDKVVKNELSRKMEAVAVPSKLRVFQRPINAVPSVVVNATRINSTTASDFKKNKTAESTATVPKPSATFKVFANKTEGNSTSPKTSETLPPQRFQLPTEGEEKNRPMRHASPENEVSHAPEEMDPKDIISLMGEPCCLIGIWRPNDTEWVNRLQSGKFGKPSFTSKKEDDNTVQLRNYFF